MIYYPCKYMPWLQGAHFGKAGFRHPDNNKKDEENEDYEQEE